MLLKQQSDHAAISWRSFNVRDNAVLEIEQPSQASLLINRVTGTLPSIISGEIRSTGIVMLVNPNGITITPDADIHGTAFLVSNRDMADAELAAAGWSGLPRLLKVATENAVNRGVPVNARPGVVAGDIDAPIRGRIYDVHVLANGRIISGGRSGSRSVTISSLPEGTALGPMPQTDAPRETVKEVASSLAYSMVDDGPSVSSSNTTDGGAIATQAKGTETVAVSAVPCSETVEAVTDDFWVPPRLPEAAARLVALHAPSGPLTPQATPSTRSFATQPAMQSKAPSMSHARFSASCHLPGLVRSNASVAYAVPPWLRPFSVFGFGMQALRGLRQIR